MDEFKIEHDIPIPDDIATWDPTTWDLIGQRFGRLLVISRVKRDRNCVSRDSRWLCKCDCGRETIVGGQKLRDGHTKSCGCLQREMSAKRARARVPDIVGQRFGRLVVLSQYGTWCRVCCDCGTEKSVPSRDLRSGRTDSCSCLKQEIVKQRQRAKLMQYRNQKGGNNV
jgi:hypothetical protein